MNVICVEVYSFCCGFYLCVRGNTHSDRNTDFLHLCVLTKINSTIQLEKML